MAVKAATTAMRNTNNFFHGAGRNQGDGGPGSNMQGPGEEEDVAEEGSLSTEVN